MNKKLTISVDDSTIKRAKQYAKSKGHSLSELIENYLKLLSRKTDKTPVSSKVSNLKGTISLPKEIEYKELLQASIFEKYLK